MRERTIKCAIWLKEQGIKAGDVVGICTSCHFDNYVPYLASIYIGAICAVEYHELPIRNQFCHFLSFLTCNNRNMSTQKKAQLRQTYKSHRGEDDRAFAPPSSFLIGPLADELGERKWIRRSKTGISNFTASHLVVLYFLLGFRRGVDLLEKIWAAQRYDILEVCTDST